MQRSSPVYKHKQSKTVLNKYDVRGQQGMDFFTGVFFLIIIILAIKQWFS